MNFILTLILVSIIATPAAASDLKVISIAGNTGKDDPVEKILDNIGAKKWQPGESPEKLARIMDEMGHKMPKKNTD